MIGIKKNNASGMRELFLPQVYRLSDAWARHHGNEA